MQIPSTPASIMKSSTRRRPTSSTDSSGRNGVGAIGNTPRYGEPGVIMSSGNRKSGFFAVAATPVRWVREMGDRQQERAILQAGHLNPHAWHDRDQVAGAELLCLAADFN